jgi:threonine synthase
MQYVSTRNNLLLLPLSTAIQKGLACDGGLFLPKAMPIIDNSVFSADMPYPEFAFNLLKDFFKADCLAPSLKSICERTFDFVVPLRKLDENSLVLELFHGPTCSFKDFGARFLAQCLNSTTHCKKTILVATSGDTGSAVANAFYRKINYSVIILYPEGQISAKQEQQMTCWDENIFSFAVNGSFDQCQQLVKLAFQDPQCQSTAELSSANSINIGRLLPQMTYYAYSSLQFYKKTRLKAGFIIPSGNLGNATAAYWAKAMGFPIRKIVLATNANRVISDYLNNGYYEPRPSIETLANAMDVGNPSNFERLSQLFDSFDHFKENVTAIAVNDETIRKTIHHIYKQYNYICCPHTATAFHVRNQLDKQPWIIVATADPCKFDELIEPIINFKVPIAPQLQKLLNKQNQILRVEANLESIRRLLQIIA